MSAFPLHYPPSAQAKENEGERTRPKKRINQPQLHRKPHDPPLLQVPRLPPHLPRPKGPPLHPPPKPPHNPPPEMQRDSVPLLPPPPLRPRHRRRRGRLPRLPRLDAGRGPGRYELDGAVVGGIWGESVGDPCRGRQGQDWECCYECSAWPVIREQGPLRVRLGWSFRAGTEVEVKSRFKIFTRGIKAHSKCDGTSPRCIVECTCI